MKCANHPNSEAVFSCGGCGRPLCGECAVTLGVTAWCRECLEKIVERSRSTPVKWPWRKIVAALLSALPGAGHMFLGLIGKGFALMGILFAAIFLIILYSDSTGMYWLAAYLIPTLCVLFVSYAVFDSMAIADAKKSGEPSEEGDATLQLVWERVLMNRRTMGWVVLVAGIVGVLNIFSTPLAAFTRTYLSLDIPFVGLLLPVVLLIIGVRLLRKGKGIR